jgi:hypothetical protein
MIKNLTMSDCKKAGYCASGVRRRIRELDIDAREFFLHGGIPLDELRHYDDEAIRRSIAVADARILKDQLNE